MFSHLQQIFSSQAYLPLHDPGISLFPFRCQGRGGGGGGGGGGELLYRQLTRVPREHIPRTLCLLNRPYAMAKVIVADT